MDADAALYGTPVSAGPPPCDYQGVLLCFVRSNAGSGKAALGRLRAPRFQLIAGNDQNPHQAAGIHTEMLFEAMWEAADVLIKRQIEVWHDPQARFMTCDAPVLIPFVRNERPGTLDAEFIVWPVSPQRVVALGRNDVGEKAVIREPAGQLVVIVRDAVE